MDGPGPIPGHAATATAGSALGLLRRLPRRYSTAAPRLPAVRSSAGDRVAEPVGGEARAPVDGARLPPRPRVSGVSIR